MPEYEIPELESTDPDLTIAEFFEIEESRICPDCGSEIESGTGFGRRDLECSDWDEDEDAEVCGWSASMRLDIYDRGN